MKTRNEAHGPIGHAHRVLPACALPAKRPCSILCSDVCSLCLSCSDCHFRCRYEVNPELVPKLEGVGLRFVGKDETGNRMEIVELRDLKYFVACQFHPEFKSRPFHPSPFFLGLILSAAGKLGTYLSGRATPVSSPVKK